MNRANGLRGSLHDYDFGQKRHWRRWLWNRIEERATRDGLIVYLAGRDNFDRDEAIRRGFSASNLVAVERDAHVTQELRRAGCLTVHGDFKDVVDALAKRHRISVVIGDYCRGLDHDAILTAANWGMLPVFREVVFAFNLMRGRDAGSNAMRDLHVELVKAMGQNHKHRGAHLLSAAITVGCTPDVDSDGCLTDKGFMRLFGRHQRSDAAFSEYKSSSGQVFDSVVYRSPCSGIPVSDELIQIQRRYFDVMVKPCAQRAVAAVMAHRTMRYGGVIVGKITQ